MKRAKVSDVATIRIINETDDKASEKVVLESLVQNSLGKQHWRLVGGLKLRTQHCPVGQETVFHLPTEFVDRPCLAWRLKWEDDRFPVVVQNGTESNLSEKTVLVSPDNVVHITYRDATVKRATEEAVRLLLSAEERKCLEKCLSDQACWCRRGHSFLRTFWESIWEKAPSSVQNRMSLEELKTILLSGPLGMPEDSAPSDLCLEMTPSAFCKLLDRMSDNQLCLEVYFRAQNFQNARRPFNVGFLISSDVVECVAADLDTWLQMRSVRPRELQNRRREVERILLPLLKKVALEHGLKSQCFLPLTGDDQWDEDWPFFETEVRVTSCQKWKPSNHRQFPHQVQREIEIWLLVARHLGLFPRGVVHLIAQELATGLPPRCLFSMVQNPCPEEHLSDYPAASQAHLADTLRAELKMTTNVQDWLNVNGGAALDFATSSTISHFTRDEAMDFRVNCLPFYFY